MKKNCATGVKGTRGRRGARPGRGACGPTGPRARKAVKKDASMRGAARIERVFGELSKKNEKALITFITAGDPSLSATEDLILAMERAGADIIELGIPFSDPMADGPTIQASSERALRGGVHLRDVIGLVRKIRKKSDIPVILFGYYNPIFAYGTKRFASEAARAGVDGVLVVDLPPEEATDLRADLLAEGLALVFLLTPVSDEKRMRLVASRGSGFIYFVSLTGVTGAREKMKADVAGHIKKLRKLTDLPVGVGFGVSSPEQAREIGASADGVIVGSAIIDIIAKKGGTIKAVKEVERFVASLKDALRP